MLFYFVTLHWTSGRVTHYFARASGAYEAGELPIGEDTQRRADIITTSVDAWPEGIKPPSVAAEGKPLAFRLKAKSYCDNVILALRDSKRPAAEPRPSASLIKGAH